MSACKIEKGESVLYYKDIDQVGLQDFLKQKFGSIVSTLKKIQYDDCDEYGPIPTEIYLIFFVKKDLEYYFYKYFCNYNYSDDDIYELEFKIKVKDSDSVEDYIERYTKSGYKKS